MIQRLSAASCAALVLAVAAAGLGACDSAEPGSPEAPIGSLRVNGGELANPAELRVVSASLSADGWVAVWHELASGPELAGTMFLAAGDHSDLVVALDPPVGAAGAGPDFQLRVSLHADAPADRAFTAVETRLDGDDPVMLNAAGEAVVGILAVSLASEPNTLVIADQTVTARPPKIDVTAQIAAVPAYVVIRDPAGREVGSERIWDKGPRSYPVSIDVPRSWQAQPLTAALYEADGNAADPTKPIRDLAGNPVSADFDVTVPPENTLDVADQTLTSFGYKIKIANLETDELPAWVAVYEDDAGAPGALIGQLAITTSPKVALGVDLTRFLAPVETLWVGLHADLAPVGTLTAADPTLLGPDRAPLMRAIQVTNNACGGPVTKLCDPAKPHEIAWLDHCGARVATTTACGEDALCDDTGPYVRCKPIPDPCAGTAGSVCVADDPTATYLADLCGVPYKVAARCGATSTCDDSDGSASCKLAASCDGNTTKVCDPTDPSKIFWLDRCGARNGNSIPCGGTSRCNDSGPEPVCTLEAGCGGNTILACNPADPANLYWRDACDVFTGATVPCGAGTVCAESDGDANCVNPAPCDGPSQKFCDPDDLSVIKWLDGCGRPKASTIPCGAGYACSDVGGEPRCVSTDVCGGNVATVCLADDPGHVYWQDACGELTGSTYPCGVASCDASGGEAVCSVIGTCADTRLRVCDPADDTIVRLENACGDDLGVFSNCANGKRCSEQTPGEATCACVPTDEVTCFGRHFLYQPSGVQKVDSCGNRNGPIVTTCANGEICFDSATGPVCATSLTNHDSPMYHRGCSFIDYVTYPTDLDVDCRCRRHDPTIDDVNVYSDGGNMACAMQDDSFRRGWTMGEGPHFRQMLITSNGGGVYSASHGELFATKNFVDSNYQGAGMVVGYDIKTGARRVVSGRFPNEAGGYTMYGSGYESQRAVGVQRFEATTFPGAWDLEQGSDGKLYVWGNHSGNKEITRVDPDSGARTLVWRQILEGEASAPPYGQCYSSRPFPNFVGGFIPVQLEDHAFAMGPDGAFYLGFRNAGAEGNGIVRIAANGATCTVLTRWNGTMGNVGSGTAPQYSTVEGFGIHAGKLYASLQIGKRLLSVDLATGERAVIANPLGSVESTPGQSTMFWDPTRNLLITAGAVQAYAVTAVDLATGFRQSLFLTAPGMPIESAPPWETGAHGAIDNGNYQGYGAMILDPDDNDHMYLVIKWGLIKYEISTGNSYVMSQ